MDINIFDGYREIKMQKIKRLITRDENPVEVIYSVSDVEITERQKDYPVLDSVSFAKKYRDSLFNGVTLKIGSKVQ